MTLGVMAEKSKKALALAMKHDMKNASDVLYRVFKDSSALFETLANTSDISTIPNVDKQISDLQQDLSQATLILNVANTNNAQSE